MPWKEGDQGPQQRLEAVSPCEVMDAIEAAYAGDMPELERLLDLGVPLDSSILEFRREGQHLWRRHPLIAAAQGGRLDCLSLLLDRGSEVDVPMEMLWKPTSTGKKEVHTGITALHSLLMPRNVQGKPFKNRFEAMRRLLTAGASPLAERGCPEGSQPWTAITGAVKWLYDSGGHNSGYNAVKDHEEWYSIIKDMVQAIRRQGLGPSVDVQTLESVVKDSASFAGGLLLEAGANSAALVKRILDRRQRHLGQEKKYEASARCGRFKARYRQLHRAAMDGNEGSWSLLASWLRSEMLWLDSGARDGLRDHVKNAAQQSMPFPDSGQRWGQLQIRVLCDEDGDYEPEADVQVDQAVILCLSTRGEGKGRMLLPSYRTDVKLVAGRVSSILDENYTHVKYVHTGPGETVIARLEQVPIHECSTCGIVPSALAPPTDPEDTLAELTIGAQAKPSSDPDVAPACNKLLKCQRCDAARYCSRACQKADWPAHKLECKILANLSKKPTR